MSQSDFKSVPIILSADEQAAALREITDLTQALAVIADELGKGHALQPELARNLLYIAEASLTNISKVTGIDTEPARRREERYTQLRKANEKVRELERLLGLGATTAQTQLVVQGLLKRIRRWWRDNGLGHLSELRLDEHGQLDVRLSCHLFGGFKTATPSAPGFDQRRKQRWFDTIRAQGFVLNDDERDPDTVVDCDASRQALIQLITTALPSAQVYSISNHVGPSGKLVMADAQVFVRKLADLDALPE
jgi:hypothetical protein